MTAKTFSSKSNAVRDAKKALGPEAIPGTDFRLAEDAGRWAWKADAAPKAAEPKDEAQGRVAATRKPKGHSAPGAQSKAPGKAAQLVELAKRPEGITTAEIMDLTGWTKIGGFHGAVERAKLVLVRRRELKETRWFAVPTPRAFAYPYFLRTEIGGRWTLRGFCANSADALREIGLDGMAVEEGEGRERGAIFIAPRAALGTGAKAQTAADDEVL